MGQEATKRKKDRLDKFIREGQFDRNILKSLVCSVADNDFCFLFSHDERYIVQGVVQGTLAYTQMESGLIKAPEQLSTRINSRV